MPMLPQLRPDIQTFVDARGLIVYDPHTGLRVLLGPESTILWNALGKGARSASALKHATPELSDAQRFVRLMQLDQALLLVSPRWKRQEHLFHTRAKSVDSPLYIHPRLTHECVQCGSSCQDIHVGPITSLTAAAIRTHELWRLDPKARNAEDILFQTQVQKQPVLMMKQVDQHCAVWSHERGCGIHATSGHKLKPTACQQYPYTMIKTSKGVYVGLQMSCRSLPQSLLAGAQYRPTEIAQRLAPIIMAGGQTQVLPAPPPLSAGSYIPDSALEEWWRWSVQVVEQNLTDIELKAREYSVQTTWRSPFKKLNNYVHEWLLRVDESEESAQWLDVSSWLFQSAVPSRHEVRIHFIDELQFAIQEASMLHQQEGRWHEMKRLERLYEAIDVWADHWKIPPLRFKGVTADYLLNLTLLEGLYSHRLFLMGDLIFGLAHLKLMLELSECIMRLSAHLSARKMIEESEVNDAIVLVYRAFKEPVIDGMLKRWAGGLRWLMSPRGMPYRHNLGTLEPHLFKLQTHMRMKSSAERAEQESYLLAKEIISANRAEKSEHTKSISTPPPAMIQVDQKTSASVPPGHVNAQQNQNTDPQHTTVNSSSSTYESSTHPHEPKSNIDQQEPSNHMHTPSTSVAPQNIGTLDPANPSDPSHSKVSQNNSNVIYGQADGLRKATQSIPPTSTQPTNPPTPNSNNT
jgi:Fe-S-cluster containining protein